MGGERYADERPDHEVHVADFRIGKYPVTNRQYAQFVAATGHEPPAALAREDAAARIAQPSGGLCHLVRCLAYCDWLSEVRGEKVRLPTEAEWEKAARGTGRAGLSVGQGPDPNKANYDATKVEGTSPVGCFPDRPKPVRVSGYGGQCLGVDDQFGAKIAETTVRLSL